MESNSDDDESKQIRISLILAPGIPNNENLKIPSDPIAVPCSIRRRGLSSLVNHLLDRKIPAVNDDDDENEGMDSDDENKLPFVPFDFILNNKLLRVSVEAAVRRERLSLEEAVEIQYFPAVNAPKSEGNSEKFPDWISAMIFIKNGQTGGDGLLYTGSYDGSIRAFDCSGMNNDGMKEMTSIQAHTGPIKCLSSIFVPNSNIKVEPKSYIATGSMDQTLLIHSLTTNTSTDNKENANISKKFNLHAVCSGGHFNSVESVVLQHHNNYTLMTSGDWDGGICLWKIPTNNESTAATDQSTGDQKNKKKRRTNTDLEKNSTEMLSSAIEIQPTSSWKAHISSISSLVWSHSPSSSATDASHHLISSSWDHSLKVWDINQEDCLLTLNGSRVVTSLDRCSVSDVVATGHPDCTVRLWDMRTGKAEVATSVSDGSLKPSHKAWISSIQWSTKEPHVLATNSHDGCIKIWDIRSSLPLHTIRAHDKGHKGLCLAFTDDSLYSGGTDCKVQKFRLKK